MSDPGLLRFRSACRTTLAVALAGTVFAGLLELHLASILAVAAGVTFTLMACSLPRDPAPRQRLVTIASMAGWSAAATAATGLLAVVPGLGKAAFLAILFGAVALQSRGPRAIACGLSAVVCSYLTLFLHADPEHLLSALLSFPVALAVVGVTGFWLVPERPEAALRRIVTTVRRRAALLLHGIGRDAEEDDPARLRRRRLFAGLNETILAAEEQLAVLEPSSAMRLSAILLRLETAVIRVSAILTAEAPLARSDRTRLRLTAMRLHAGRASRLRERAAGSAALAAALTEIEQVATELAETALPGRPSRPTVEPDGKPAPPAWRPAIRAGLAALLSMVGGLMISPDRWFWAVLTAYLVFLGARSRGETIFKGVQRLWGTLVGLVVGVLASVALSGHPALEAVGLLVCVFGLTYVFAVSQTLAIFCVTVLLGLVYSLLGNSAEAILVLRLEETAIGAAAAILVGLVVLPRRTHDLVHDTGNLLVVSLAQAVRLSADRLARSDGPDPVAAMRQADRHFRDLRAALRPLQASRALAWWARAPAELPAILACMFWVRVLASTSRGGGSDPALAALSAEAERLAGRLEGIAEAPRSAANERPEGDMPIEVEIGHMPHSPAALVQTALDNLHSIVDVMVDRFAAEGWNALIAKRPI